MFTEQKYCEIHEIPGTTTQFWIHDLNATYIVTHRKEVIMGLRQEELLMKFIICELIFLAPYCKYLRRINFALYSIRHK